MSQFIVQCLNPYRKPDCKVGRITTTEDFKHLARKVLPCFWSVFCCSYQVIYVLRYSSFIKKGAFMCQMLRLGAQECEVWRWESRPLTDWMLGFSPLSLYQLAPATLWFHLKPVLLPVKSFSILMVSVVSSCALDSWLTESWIRSWSTVRTLRTWSAMRMWNTKPRSTLRSTCRSLGLFTNLKRTLN